MKLRDLLKTNTNEIDTFYIYLSQEAFDDLDPDIEVSTVNGIIRREMDSVVAGWFMDVNFCLHVLIPYEG